MRLRELGEVDGVGYDVGDLLDGDRAIASRLADGCAIILNEA